MIEIGFVGPGRVGRALVSLLPRDAYRLGPILATTYTSARRAAREMQLGRPAEGLDDFSACAVILVAVPAAEVKAVAEQLATAPIRFARRVVLHTNGPLGSDALDPLRVRGAALGCLCPLQVIQGPVLSFAGTRFIFEGDPAAVRPACGIVRSLGGEWTHLAAEQKALVAAAASLVTDAFTGLIEMTVRRLTAAGVPRKRALEAVERLVADSLEVYARSGRSSRPGPFLSKDRETSRLLLEASDRAAACDPESYRAALRLTQEILELPDEPTVEETAADLPVRARAAKAGGL